MLASIIYYGVQIIIWVGFLVGLVLAARIYGFKKWWVIGLILILIVGWIVILPPEAEISILHGINLLQRTSEQTSNTSTTAEEIENLKKEIETLKNQQPQVVVKETPTLTSQGQEIRIEEITPYLSGVGSVICGDSTGIVSRGSGSLYKNYLGSAYSYAVLTNKHVLATDKCSIFLDEIGMYNLDSQQYNWNVFTDIALIKITSPVGDSKPRVENLNFSLSNLKHCSPKLPLGSSVITVGYPSFSQQSAEVEGIGNTLNLARTLSNGIISAYDTTNSNLPHPDYFVSAKIDSGNSGGIAFSKENSELCLFGVPTWLSVGNYETQGVVQNISNIVYVPKNKFEDLFKNR